MWIRIDQPEGQSGEIRRFVRDDEFTEKALFVSVDRKRAWYREIHF